MRMMRGDRRARGPTTLKSAAIQMGLAVVAALSLAACSGQIDGLPEPRKASSQSLESGRALMAAYGCGTCHTIPGVPGADAQAGPPLDQYYRRSFIAGRLPNTENTLVEWIQDPQQIEPGTAMPNLGVTEAEARDMVAYLYHQPTLNDWFNR
jgi:cytochrome c